MKNIHLSLSQQDKVYAMKFLNSNNLKKELKYDDELIEIEISSNNKEKINTEEITEEITNLIINIMRDKLLKEYILKQYNDIYFNDKDKIYVYSFQNMKKDTCKKVS